MSVCAFRGILRASRMATNNFTREIKDWPTRVTCPADRSTGAVGHPASIVQAMKAVTVNHALSTRAAAM
jgi:hypothetical protein